MFYGEKLQQIREMFSYTRKDLAEIINVNEQTVWRYETNQERPTFNVLIQLTDVFNVKSSYFLKDSYLTVVSQTSNIAFRESYSQKRTSIKNEQVFLDFFYTHLLDIEKVAYPVHGKMNSFCGDIEKNYNLTQLSKHELKEIAEEARETLGTVSNERLMYFLETSGIYIIERKLEKSVDAYSTWLLEDSYPIIVLNKGKNPAVRRNFDMSHELGHLILHRYIDFNEIAENDLRKIEKEANLFASYFMLPERELEEDFSKIINPTNPKEYLPLKNKYKTSIQSIAYRANLEGWITKSENSMFWKNIHKLGYRFREPLDNDLPIHIPGKIRALISHALKEDSYFITNWVERYSVEIEYFEKLFGIHDDFFKKHRTQERINPSNKVVNLYQ
ncbi:XRE family transcriptional regulator [Alkalibacterium iburiense]|uniref:XRE family transcriptional regulator n=1 Tax=Alkalibacterium iburiense TaxID=290589 RepID=A0ABP3H9R1_9LACT